MTPTDIAALLTGPAQEGGIDIGDDGAYVDWSTRDDENRICLELGDGTDAVSVAVTRDQLVAAYRAIGTWLIQNPA
jgi:hypothetical protein